MLTDPFDYLTAVGWFWASPGPYGTFDMGGDLWQWNETAVTTDSRGLRGGEFGSGASYLASSERLNDSPMDNFDHYGFRVAASVAEPSTITLLLASAACLLGYAWRRRRRA